jgi:putative hydrolase of the HAD superfamily
MVSEQIVTHVLLDFFGTLVDYSPSRTEQGYHASHALACSMGARIDYPGFLRAWAEGSARFDERSAVDDSEFSMEEVTAAVLRRLLRRDPTAAETAALAGAYLREWNTGVVYPPGMPEIVGGLADRFRLAVVTNTHQADLVPGHLAAMGIDRYVETVVTSVEVGWRKPHPAIYRAALRRLEITPANAVFAGDTYAADYAGPAAAGMTAFLIDPAARHNVPASRRLRSLADLAGRLPSYEHTPDS